jgi:tRNA pseudouridine55 synthase
VRLGITTSTADAEGEVIATAPWEGVDEARIRTLLPRFTGEIEQLPPMYSAVKHKGERLYNLARQGIEVEREPRRITIYRLELTEWAPPELSLDVHCSKGTYVRTLAEDLGNAAGCGAHVSGLRRSGVGPYGTNGPVTLERVEAAAQEGYPALDALLLPMQSALAHWPELRVSDDAAYYMKQGQPVLVPQAPPQGWVRLYTKAGQFLGVGSILDDGRVQPRRLLGAG